MNTKSKLSISERILNKIEVIGNKLPDPVTIFALLIVLLMIVSIPLQGTSAINPVDGQSVMIKSLFSAENLSKLLTEMVAKFQNFPPLGMVLVVMLGAGVAIKTGFLDVLMKAAIVKVPEKLVTTVIILVALLADGAGDAGFIILPPLAAIIYVSMGRNPLAGMFAAFACVSIGFATDFFINMTDVLFAAFTIPAAQLIDPSYQATPAMNWYYMIPANVVIIIAMVWVTDKIVAPRLDKIGQLNLKISSDTDKTLTEIQRKGLRWAMYSLLLIIIAIVALCIGPDAFMKDPVTGSLLAYKSPLMQGMIPLMTLIFLIPGIIYGIVTGSIKSDKDVTRLMSESMAEMGGYMVIALVASVFIALFSWSNIGFVLSILGADWIKGMGLDGGSLLIALILLTMVIGIFITSASAKWAILAPVFVPMLMLLGYDPAVTQTAFRIGDGVINPVSPLFIYFPMLLAYARQYKPDLGLGTIIANMIPFCLVSLVLLVIVMIVFIIFQIPVGPGSDIFYQLK